MVLQVTTMLSLALCIAALAIEKRNSGDGRWETDDAAANEQSSNH